MGGKCSILRPDRLMRLSRNNQLAKFGSMSTFRSVNWSRNDAWPIQVTATWPKFNLGKVGCFCWPVRRVSRGFQTLLWEKGWGLECFGRGKYLKGRGRGGRGEGGREVLGLPRKWWYF